MSFATLLTQWTGHGSGAGLTTAITAAETFEAALVANLPTNGATARATALFDDRLLHLMEEYASEFRTS